MAKFSQRHYEAVAKVLASVRPPHGSPTPREQWERTVEAFTKAFVADHAKFQIARFIKAVHKEGEA